MSLTTRHIKEFQSVVWKYYRLHGRVLPWRDTRLPYRIFVSEVMLQQTQAERVVPFYNRFLEQFPSVSSLARAPMKKVLALWQGLGYNRRALHLKHAAEAVVKKHKGKFPVTLPELDDLPGVGIYTPSAVMAFAYNKPAVFIETNIRAVFLHFFFKKRTKVSDNEILAFVGKTLDRDNPREWYQALMDYGAMLKRTIGNPNVRSRTYVKQSRFEGSRRQIRGRLVKLALQKTLTLKRLESFCREFKIAPTLTQSIISDLVSEKFLYVRGSSYMVS